MEHHGLKDKRIFIIEDNPANFAIAKTLLELQGAKVAFERHGDTAINRLKAFAPVDLILLDLMLPNNVSGYDVFDQIRILPDFDAIPIVAFSASDPAIAIPKAQAKGFAGFIAKPINYDQLPKQIEQVLNREEVWVAH